MRGFFFISLSLCSSVLAKRAYVLNEEEVCDIELEREVRQSGNKFEIVTSLYMDHDHFKECMLESPVHPFMTYVVCNVHIRENFPSNLAIDQKELQFLESKYNYRAFTPSPIDPRESTNTSSPFQLDLYMADVWPNPDWIGYPASLDVIMHLPVHPRIHEPAPAEGVTHVDFELPPPSRVGLKCVPHNMERVWDPIEKRKNHILRPPHGLNFRTKSNYMSHHHLTSMVESSHFVEVKVTETEAHKFKVPVDALPDLDVLREADEAIGAPLDLPRPVGMGVAGVVGIGGTAVLLIVVALWKAMFSPELRELHGTESASSSASKTDKKAPASGSSSRKKTSKVE